MTRPGYYFDIVPTLYSQFLDTQTLHTFPVFALPFCHCTEFKLGNTKGDESGASMYIYSKLEQVRRMAREWEKSSQTI